MPTYEVDVGGKTYEVDAPDPNTAWQWANYTNKNQPEEPGFLERAKTATKRGFEQIPESAAGISMGIKAALGMKPEAGAQAEQIRQEAQRQSMETPGITFEELQKTYGKDGAIEMLKKLPTYVAEQILSNAPSMAVPLAVGAGAGAVSGPLAPIVAPVAGIGTYGLQQFGQFMRRQAEEGRTGQTLEPGTAALAAGLTAPIGYFADRFTLGLGNIPEKILGKEIAAELAKRTGQSVAGRAATGATVGVIAEAPTEVLEQAAERWQAGLSLTNEDAKREYMEAAAGAAAVGGVGGAATRALRRPGEAPAPEITVPEVPPTQAPVVTPEVTSVPETKAQDTSAMMREVEALLAGKVAQEEPVSRKKPVEPKVTPTPVTPPEISTSGTEMVNLPPAEPVTKAEPVVAEEPKEPEVGKPVAPADAIVFKTSGEAHDYAIKNNVPGIVINTDKGYALDVGDVEPQYLTTKPAEPAKPAEVALPEAKPTVAEAPKGIEVKPAEKPEAPAPVVKAQEEQLPDDKTRVLNALKKDNENTAQFVLERAISVANEANKPVNVFSHDGQIKRQVEGMPLPKYARMIGKINPEPDYEFQTNANTRAQAPVEEVKAPEVEPAETPVVETPTAEVSATEETKAPESIQVLMRLQDVAYQEKAPKDPELKSWLSDNGLIEVEGEKAKITPVGKKLLERLNPVGLSAPRITTEEAANIIKEFTRSNRPTPRVEPPVAAPKVEPIKEPVAPEIKAETPAPEKKLTYLEPVQSLERSIEIANEYVNKFNQGDFKKPSRYSASSSAKVSEKDAVRQMNTDQDFAYNKAAKEFLEGDLTAKVPSKKQDKIDVVRTGYLPLKDISPKPIEKGIVSRAPTDNVGQRRALSYIINDKDIRTYLRGVHIDPKKGVMVATDGHRLATLNKAKFEGLPPNPQGYTVIDAKNNWIEGKYPDYERVTPKQHFGNKMRVDAAPMGDYARGVTRAAKYVEEKYPAVRLKIGDQVTGVNPEYLAEMTDMFRRFGYSSFDISSSDKQIFASSPDGKLIHVVMPINKPSEVFAAYEPKESTGKAPKKPIAPKPVKAEAKPEVKAPEEKAPAKALEELTTAEPKKEELSETGLSSREIAELKAELVKLEADLDKTIGPQKYVIQDDINSIRDMLGLPLENVEPDFERKSLSVADNFTTDRKDLIRRWQSIRQQRGSIIRKFAKGEAGLKEQQKINAIEKISKDLKQYIEDTKPEKRSALDFFNKATDDYAKENITEDVYAAIKTLYEKYPFVLEGLKLSVPQPKKSGTAGEYDPSKRIVRLYKGTVGVREPVTIRHEIVHSLEQMMLPDAASDLIMDWSDKLGKAIKQDKNAPAQQYFQAILEYFDEPSITSYRRALSLMPSYDYYQYINPSEYWAVNAEKLMARKLGSGWDRFVLAVKRLFEGLKYMFGFDNQYIVHKAFNDIMGREGGRFTKASLNEYVKASIGALENIDPEAVNTRRNILGHPAPLSVWDAPEQSKLSDWEYRWIDKHTDTKNVVKKVNEAIGEVEDRFDPYLKETLYHGRSTEATLEFAKNEFRPLIEKMAKLGVRLDEFQNYLHNRHAPRYNEIIDERNDNPDIAGRGSGIETEKAEKYMADLAKNNPELKAKYESLAKDVDAIVKGTQDILVNSGLETKERIASWRKMFPDYVPLKRDPTELDFVNPNFGVGKGFAVSGDFSRSSTGSLKTVVDILNNIAVQRELAISRAERARVGAALYGLAIKAPNPNFWMPINPDAVKDLDKLKQELMDMGLSKDDAENIFEQPKIPTLDKKSNQVKLVVNRMMLRNENVFPVRINGKDRFIIFNPGDPVALRMVKSLKNLDANQLSNVLGTMAEATRLIAAMNTQYNPVFGAWNFARDLGGAAINLSSTPIANKRFEVISGAVPALRAIYRQLRGKPPRNEAEKKLLDLERRFAKGGGKTGYKEQFARADNRASLVERELKRIDRTNFRKAADAVSDWLSDYNDAMENAVRLSAFKVALESGVSEERALEIAKNLTVNFNRKGAWTSNVNAFYAFFNASVQGTARLAQVIFSKDSKGNVRLTKAGKKIFAGGMALGAMQALVLAVAGFDSDEPPEFLKNKNLIIPTTGGNYLIVPMPLGFNVFPNVGRLITEYALTESGAMTGKRDLPKTLQSVVAAITDAFNPLGSSGLIQTMSPTLVDPFAALATNKDAFGRPISKENRATNPTPGYERSRDNATALSQGLAYGINYLTGGGKYGIGMWSPTADDIDYFAGQYMGGLGREIVKAGRFAAAKTEGEETPPYKVPILGKLYGETETPSAVTDKFYKNVTMLAELEGEMKRMREKHADTSEFREENPEYRYIKSANNLENQITKINKTIKELHKREETPEIKERIERLKEQKTRMMNSFNERIKNLQRE